MGDQFNNHFARQGNNKPSSKVYINPNYNRKTDNIPKQSSTMYVNPNFCKMPSAPHNYHDNTRTRIYLNPNFIRNSVPSPINQTVVDNYTRPETTLVPDVPNFNVNYQQSNILKTRPAVSLADQTMTQITKSRYCLVNKHEHRIKPTLNLEVNSENITVPKVQSNTVRVNKYKLIPISDVKTKLSVEKKVVNNIAASISTTNNISPRYKSRIKPVVRNVPNRFKLVKHSTVQLNSPSIFKFRSTAPLPRKKIVKGVLKKNNIPCPLFKKFGKCLRKNRGHCEYLHDKKHVSICRKFLKGICHDEHCLLSHDLTDKKMPTCYFYLKGACIKENCPYLHVKLNDKANICQDFLKGYCEKGDTCLNRHVDLNPDRQQNQDRRIVRRASTAKLKVNVKRRSPKKDIPVNKVPLQGESKNGSEKRYFIESIDRDAEKYDVIKPTRCKLGTLPSFIQL